MTSTVLNKGLAQSEIARPHKRGSRPKRNWSISVGSLIASLLVGTIVTLINHGDALFSGNLSLSFAWVIPLNYAVSWVLVVVFASTVSPHGHTAPGLKDKVGGSNGHRKGEGS